MDHLQLLESGFDLPLQHPCPDSLFSGSVTSKLKFRKIKVHWPDYQA